MAEYTTIELLEAIELTPTVRNFLTKTFFPVERTHVAEEIEFDVKKGKRIMAPFVSPRVGGKVITRQGYKTNRFTTPRIAPERLLTIDDLSKRLMGETIYSKRTPSEREDELLASDYKELDESIQRRLEWMARQILFTGKLDVVDTETGVDLQVDYGFSNQFVLEPDQYWSLPTVDPLLLLAETRRKIIKETGKAPNLLILSSDIVKSFLTNSFVEKEMNLLRYKNIIIEPRVVDPALTYYGRIQELDFDLYSYDEYFMNDEGEEESIVPKGACLMAHSDGVGGVEYGLITQYEEDKKAHSYESKQVTKIYVEGDVKKIRLTSRPLPRPFDVESWAVIYPIGQEEFKQKRSSFFLEETKEDVDAFSENGFGYYEKVEGEPIYFSQEELNKIKKKADLVNYGKTIGLELSEEQGRTELIEAILNYIEENQEQG